MNRAYQRALEVINACRRRGDTALDLGGMGLTALPPEIGQLTALTELGLSINQLTALPPEIGQLTALTKLGLDNNLLEALPPEIGQLTALKELGLDNNQLAALPPEIGQLTALKELGLSRNQLTALPREIAQLTALKDFWVRNNHLKALPPEIGQLSALTRLGLDGNQLTALPPEIGQLTALTRLDLDANHLAALPQKIGQLTALKALCLRENQLTALPPEISQLASLTELRLDGNHLTALPPEIGQLTALTRLDLDANQLAALPPEIGQLTALNGLWLRENQLTALPPEIGQLTALTELVLDGNQLMELPPELRMLRGLRRLFLHHNPALNLPSEVLGYNWIEVLHGKATAARPTDLLTYYFESLGGAPLNEVKLLLVGRGGAGKSSLLERLRHGTFTPDRKETPGIDIQPWQVMIGSEKVTIHAWDFAGQVITHAAHQFFLSSRSVYVLALTGRENTERGDAEYWLRLIRAFATDGDGTAPVVVALNKCEITPCRLDRNILREKYPFIAAFVETDCESGLGIAALERTIFEVIGGMEGVRRKFPPAWRGIKEALSKPKGKLDYLSYEAFRDLCAQHGERDPGRQDQLSRILHQLGIALNYAEDERLRETTVLSPQWLTGGIYTLLRQATRPDRPEEMTPADVARVLPKESEEMRRYLVELMRRFELVFPMDESGKRWLVPQRLSENQPKLDGAWHASDATRLRYRYAALPEGLIPRFITRTHPLSEGQARWVNGVILANAGAQVLVRADAEERWITLTAIGDAEARPALLGLATDEMDRIHGDIRGLEPKLEVELEGRAGEWVLVQALKRDEAANKEKSFAATADGTVEIDNTKELNLIQPEAAREARRRLRVFVSYSKRDLKAKDELLARLKLLVQEGLIEPWHDRDIRPGEDWNEAIQKQLQEADVALCLVSDAFLTTDYIMQKEIPVMLEHSKMGECLVVPIIWEGGLWTRTPLNIFNALPAKGKPIRDTKPQRRAWEAVQRALAMRFEEVVAKPIQTSDQRPIVPMLSVTNFGPIKSAEVEFGNLTVLVGPQASGKSIFLQLLKLLVDIREVKDELKKVGIELKGNEWEGSIHPFLEVYFGEGMGHLVEDGTKLSFKGNSIKLSDFVRNPNGDESEGLFYIPAQRVLALREGWPQPFDYYNTGIPYAVREFSETLRLLMADPKGNGELFPVPRWLKDEFRELIGKHFFPGFDMGIDVQHKQRRLVLSGDEGRNRLPYMVWSAGQREFVPLLLGLYHLMPRTAAPKREDVQWVVIEEPEMGLHPRATAVAMLMVFDLMARGYRVCISTHSPQVLDAVWALNHLRENGADSKDLLRIFDAVPTTSMIEMAESVMTKTVKVYYFDRESGTAKDISGLDPESEDAGEGGWGGLAEFSGRANTAVARAVANRREIVTPSAANGVPELQTV